MDVQLEKPELINTGSGFSVFYKNKYLYSKYSPQKAILSLIEKLEIQPNTLVLCCSPVLGYGLSELLNKLPDNSFAAAVEADENLMAFSVKMLNSSIIKSENIFYARTNSIKLFLKKLERILNTKKITKVIRLDFSAGVNLSPEFYCKLENAVTEFISQFWINRLTLIQLGRNFSKNFLKNYAEILKTPEKFSLFNAHTIDKPVLVIGAGPSLDCSLEFIKKHKTKFFIIAVDAAVGIYPEIKPDAVIILESQYWIRRAFIGLKNSNIPILADLTSVPASAAANFTGGKFAFFFTEYIKNPFFSNLADNGILPIQAEAMGSVGLTALYIAEKISTANAPIFHTGLDFSWGRGFTHSRKSYQLKSIFAENSRIHSLYTPVSLFGESVIRMKGKNNQEIFTSPNLKNYAEIYKTFFSKNNLIFDLGKTGIEIKSNLINEKTAEQILEKFANRNKTDNDCFLTDNYIDKKTAIHSFLQYEKQKLQRLKNIFTLKIEAPPDETKSLLQSCPYLYFHFADFSEDIILNQHFLNRIRAEIEYFLKYLNSV